MAQEYIPYYGLEERKDPRGHALTKVQIKWAVIGGGIAFLLLLTPSAFLKLLALPVLIVVAAGTWKYEDGLGFRVLQTRLQSRHMRKTASGNIEIAKAKTPPIGLRIIGIGTSVDQVFIPDEFAENLNPEDIRELEEGTDQEQFELGAVYSRQENADTAFVVGTGMDSAQFDSAELFAHRNRVVNAIRNVALASDEFPSFSLIWSTRPCNLEGHLFWCEDNLDPEVNKATPAPFESEEAFLGASVEERQAASIGQMQNFARADSPDVTMAVGITVPRPASWPKRKDGGLDGLLSPEQLQRAPITNLTLLLEQELEDAGVTGAAALSFEDIGKFVRMGWDLKGIRAWQKQVSERAIGMGEYFIKGNTSIDLDAIPEEPSSWPEHQITAGKSATYKDFLNTDGTYHRVLQVGKFKKQRVFAEDFLPLFNSRDIRPSAMTGLTISECGDIVSVYSEQKALSRKIVLREGLRRNKVGERYQSPADQEKEGRLRKKQEMLHYGGALAFSYNVFITISATDPALLDQIETHVQRHARKVGAELRYIEWEARQLRAFVTANFGVNMATQ